MTFTAHTRTLVTRRAQNRCERCGCWAPAPHLHHRKLRRHGDHTPSNAIAVCFTCHELIHRTADYETGFLLHSWDNPEETPVRLAIHGLAFLLPNGEWTRHPQHAPKL